MDVLRAALNILVVLPIKADIKHDWYLLENKIKELQRKWNISPLIRCSWQITEQDLAIRVTNFGGKLAAYCEDSF